MRVSKDKQNEYISRIRRLLVLNPDLTIMKCAEKMKIDKDYAHKLMNKIRKEKNLRYDHVTINKYLSEFEDRMSETTLHLWQIVQDKEAPHVARVGALREIRNNDKEVFDRMADAGVFERSLGTMKIEGSLSKEMEDILDQAIEHAKIRGQRKKTSPRSNSKKESDKK